MLTFGITLKPDMTPQRVVALTRQAEAAGFTYGWLFDSHVLWLEPYPLLTLMAPGDKAHAPGRLRHQSCRARPDRHGERAGDAQPDLRRAHGSWASGAAIARGACWASARRHWPILRRRRRISARWPQANRSSTRASRSNHLGARATLPAWIAGYGPKALRLAGRIADGVILQFADPHLIKWCIGFVHEGAREAGRDPSSIEIMAAAPVWVSDDLAVAREHVRWFPGARLESCHGSDRTLRSRPSCRRS